MFEKRKIFRKNCQILIAAAGTALLYEKETIPYPSDVRSYPELAWVCPLVRRKLFKNASTYHYPNGFFFNPTISYTLKKKFCQLFFIFYLQICIQNLSVPELDDQAESVINATLPLHYTMEPEEHQFAEKQFCLTFSEASSAQTVQAPLDSVCIKNLKTSAILNNPLFSLFFFVMFLA